MSTAPPWAGFRCLMSRTDSVSWADPQRPGSRTTSLMVAVRLDRAGNRLHRLLAVRLPVLAGSCSTWRWSRSSSACAGTSVPMRCDGLPECADVAGSEPDRRLMCAGRCYAMPCACARVDRTVRMKVEYITKSISATIGLQVGCLRPRVVRCFQLGSTVGLCSAGVVCDR